jgi:hypothetical protein
MPHRMEAPAILPESPAMPAAQDENWVIPLQSVVARRASPDAAGPPCCSRAPSAASAATTKAPQMSHRFIAFVPLLRGRS